MRLGTVNIGGDKYPACFSARIMLELESEGDSVQEKLSKIADSGRMSELLPILHKMLVSGHRYAERHGIENPGEISYDDFVDDIGPDDFDGLFKATFDIIKNTGETTVEAAPPKNVEGTRRAAK